MSLLQNYESIYGASFKEAYHRILEANFDYINMKVMFKIGVYCDEDARNTEKPPLYIRKVTIDIDEKMFALRKPIYNYLKGTNDYQETKDV